MAEIHTIQPSWRNEKAFMASIIRAAKAMHWHVYHTHYSKRSEAGFPDLVLVREQDARLIFAEVKGPRGILTDAQHKWLRALTFANAETYVWYPKQWDEILGVLKLPGTRGDIYINSMPGKP